MKFLKRWFKKNTPPTYPTASEMWEGLSESEKDDLRYFQKNMYRGLGLNEDGTKKKGPSITIDGKVVAQAKPGGTISIKRNKVSVDELDGLD